MTNSSSLYPMSTTSCDDGAFSKREIVDCEARSGSDSGSRPTDNFNIGSRDNAFASTPSSYPRAIEYVR